jgi:hypothetical protein
LHRHAILTDDLLAHIRFALDVNGMRVIDRHGKQLGKGEKIHEDQIYP